MDRLLSQPPTYETFRSFDILASIDLLRFDLSYFNYIKPETRQRVYDEELTYICEGINKPLYTEFTLPEVNGQLSYFNEAEWQPYIKSLERALKVAEVEANQDSRKEFLAERARKDLLVGVQLLGLNPGEQMAWYSNFPDAACQLYGDEFVGKQGFQVCRRMGFIHQAKKNQDGSLTLMSQSVDNSNEEAFAAAMYRAERDKSATLDDLRQDYDRVLGKKQYGLRFYAGRVQDSSIPEKNAWALVKAHEDLIKFYFDHLEALAGQSISREKLEIAKKRLTYGVWATLKERLDKATVFKSEQKRSLGFYDFQSEAWVAHEIEQAYESFSKRGEVLFGCGGSISGDQAILEESAESIFESIFSGRKSKMECVTCPFCNKIVNAKVTKDRVSCPKCQASVKR